MPIEEPLTHEASFAAIAGDVTARTPRELASIVSDFVASHGWMEKVRLQVEKRWYERVYQGPDHDVWIISWLPGQSTGFHDHGASSGAFVVASGVLEEHRPGEPIRLVSAGEPCAFGPDYAHDVCNGSAAPAISVHAYSPPLSEMNEYEVNEGQLVPREVASRRDESPEHARHRLTLSSAARRNDERTPASIDAALAAARARLRRLSPDEAADAVIESQAILVDIRPDSQRAYEGSIAGALVVERNVLEWRLDPSSSARLPVADNHDLQMIVFCSEGYASSLAAASLRDLGLWRATDMIGGFQAWRAAGLPIVPPGSDV